MLVERSQRIRFIFGSAREVRAIQQVVNSKNLPLHLLLVAFALARFRGKLEQLQKEMAEWESVTLGADIADDEPAKVQR
ncbi:MAG: hypothetical protein ACYDBH_10570 [Acidobacteriaceae bacterium]